MASASKSFSAAPEAGSALAQEREQRKQIPQTSKANSTSIGEPRNLSMEDQIRVRAYELYVERGRHDGHAEQDWLDAEYEILANR